MYNENLQGGLGDFFNNALKEIAPTLKSTLKEAAGKLVVNAKSTTQAQLQTVDAKREAIAANQKLQKNRQLMIVGGIGAAALLTLVLLKK